MRESVIRSLQTSSRLEEGVEAILQHLDGEVSVFAGQSGVGKSSLLNKMISGLDLGDQCDLSTIRKRKAYHTSC